MASSVRAAERGRTATLSVPDDATCGDNATRRGSHTVVMARSATTDAGKGARERGQEASFTARPSLLTKPGQLPPFVSKRMVFDTTRWRWKMEFQEPKRGNLL